MKSSTSLEESHTCMSILVHKSGSKNYSAFSSVMFQSEKNLFSIGCLKNCKLIKHEGHDLPNNSAKLYDNENCYVKKDLFTICRI